MSNKREEVGDVREGYSNFSENGGVRI